MTLGAAGKELVEALNVREVGEAEGQRTVVMAHGFGCTQSVWDAVLPMLLNYGLEGGVRIIVFDWPGAPSCKLKPLPLFYNAFSEILFSLLQELHVSSCIFVGHSMSAMIGCITALRQPSLFHKLILVGASPRYLNGGDYYGGFEQEDLEHMYNAMATNFKGWAAGFARMVVGEDSAEEAIEKFAATLSSMRADVALGMAKTIFQSDFRGVVEELCLKLQAPDNDLRVVLLQMHKDVAVPLVVADYFKLRFGNQGAVEVLQTEGHLPHLSAPHLFAEALLRQLN